MHESPRTLLFIVLSATSLVLSLVAAGSVLYGSDIAAPVTAFAAVFVLVTFAILNVVYLRMNAEIKEARAAARDLASGQDFKPALKTELIDSLADVSAYMRDRAATCSAIASGRLGENVVPRNDADMLGNAMLLMTEQLRLLVETEEKRESLQYSVNKLLREVSEVSVGDLTVQAEADSEITGEIADAFNSMTRNLRSLIKQVKDVAFQVGSLAKSINETTEQLADGSDVQASQIARTTEAISQMSRQIQDVSEKASLSAAVAGRSLENATLGTAASRDTIAAMESIRGRVQETAKRIKKLGERSQEITQIVALIDDLSDRTALLALNATLRASAAGETSAEYLGMAEEVEKLAERSIQLTEEIASLTRSINSETKDAVTSMEEVIREVVIGSELANKAGSSLVEIEDVSRQLATLIQAISESSRIQAKSSGDISAAMAGISKVTGLVENGSKRAADSVKNLVRLSDDLKTSVAPFKLPADMPPRVSTDHVSRLVN
ncbi:MAG: methyl-accepting chemotaxis protein [Blastocatellia bacterium]|nr:methyl-accepting chemotaxis protein [Blastocatellia bacterium]